MQRSNSKSATISAMADLKDHREIGKEQDLFVLSDLVGSGLPLFTPKGAILRKLIEDYMFDLLQKEGFDHVWSTHIARKKLFEISGHYEKYKEDMFPVMDAKDREYMLKGMSCPLHIQIFNRKPMSYRDMPQRYAETATVYRSEQSGELMGLTRVLSITQDDAHIFCRPDQIKDEFKKALEVNKKTLSDFGFKEYWIRLSLWDPENREKYLGDEETWRQMQDLMRDLLKETDTPFKEATGEAAFYGPKMDLMAIDSHGREWQLSTIQLDFNLPERFNLSYVGEDGKEHRLYMLHRATFGSIERFMGVWLEHIGGLIPLWLAPVQTVIVPVTDRSTKYAQKLVEQMTEAGIRAQVDDRSETMQSKIRDAELQKVPYIVVVGDKEQESGNIAVRTRGQKDIKNLQIPEFIQQATSAIAKRTLEIV